MPICHAEQKLHIHFAGQLAGPLPIAHLQEVDLAQVPASFLVLKESETRCSPGSIQCSDQFLQALLVRLATDRELLSSHDSSDEACWSNNWLMVIGRRVWECFCKLTSLCTLHSDPQLQQYM